METKKYGRGKSRAEVKVLVIHTSKTTANFIKKLMSSACLDPNPTLTFILEGFNVTEGKKSHNLLLRDHKKVISTLTCVAVYGINPDALSHIKLCKDGNRRSFSQWVKEKKNVRSIELTNESIMKGKHLLIVDRQHVVFARKWVDSCLPGVYRAFLGKCSPVPGYKEPRR